jgi:alkylation response protein AidB-like acyl-CoA dehydrogenase
MGVAGTIGSHSLACWIIANHGTEEQKQRWLPKLATGEIRTGIGLTEPAAGSDLQGIQTRATLDGDHYIVRGTQACCRHL